MPVPPRRLMLAAVSTALGVLAVWSLRPTPEAQAADPPPAAPRVTVYDPNPEHLWNRLHDALYVRLDGIAPDDPTELDPVIWEQNPFRENGERSKLVLAVLDEFVAKRGDKLIADPRKRALLQRDLWVLFDAVAPPRGGSAVRDKFGSQIELARRLATILPRLALTADQIKALPDNFAEAVAGKKFPNGFDAGRLWAPDGPWVLVGTKQEVPVARTHVEFFGGRSAFFVFLRLSGGREATVKHVAELQSRGTDAKPPDGGMTFALVRQMLLFDDTGRIVLTPVVESVQLRGLGVHKLKLNRTDFVDGKPSLIALGPDDLERDYITLLGQNVGGGRTKALNACPSCHTPDRLESHLRKFSPYQGVHPSLTASNRDDEAASARRGKWNSYQWGLLQGLMLAAPRE